jgi:hypothetical protein
MTEPLKQIRAALADCDAAIEKLDKLCCEPGRSPRIAALGQAIDEARTSVSDLDGSAAASDATVALLEVAGGQTGALQVGCCAPNRLPLYERVLENLTTAQRAVNETAGRAH